VTELDDFATLEQALESAFAVEVPALTFRQPVDSGRHSTARGHGGVFALTAGAVAVAILGAVIVLPGLFGEGATTANAEELVNRSSAATADLNSGGTTYHLRATIQGKSSGAMTSEVWSFGAAGNRTEQTFSENGVTQGNGQVATPQDYWIWASTDGQTTVAHVAGDTTRLKDAVPADGLAGVLQGLVVPGCQEAVLDGPAKVAGRQATVVRIQPTPATCKQDPARPETLKLARVVTEMGSTTLWIDSETFVQLKVQNFDASGALQTSYEVQLFETGESVDASVLNYTPPAGASLHEVNSYSDAKSAIYPPKPARPDDASAAEAKGASPK
jgi:hypothetical protein